ncbi:MAG: hypothetical protein A4E19_15515 [Nitrospira sp. SG-bin1]|nr:MAG: hypothetical protein A4E19_15515 [Nitrospira sp. SG-bin1]
MFSSNRRGVDDGQEYHVPKISVSSALPLEYERIAKQEGTTKSDLFRRMVNIYKDEREEQEFLALQRKWPDDPRDRDDDRGGCGTHRLRGPLMKVVFDTRVFVSAFIVPGSRSEQAFLLAQRRAVELSSDLGFLNWSVSVIMETLSKLQALL